MPTDFSKKNEEIYEEEYQRLKKVMKQVPDEVVREIARKSFPFLECAMQKVYYKENLSIVEFDQLEPESFRVSPTACMGCSFGHMTECHYPYGCRQANCSHYQSERMAESE